MWFFAAHLSIIRCWYYLFFSLLYSTNGFMLPNCVFVCHSFFFVSSCSFHFLQSSHVNLCSFRVLFFSHHFVRFLTFIFSLSFKALHFVLLACSVFSISPLKYMYNVVLYLVQPHNLRCQQRRRRQR